MPERVALRSSPWRRRCWHIPALNRLITQPESDVATVNQGSVVDTPFGDFENSALLMQVTKLIAVRSIVYGSSNKLLNHVEEKSKFMLNYQTAQATVSSCDIPTFTCESSSSTSSCLKIIPTNKNSRLNWIFTVQKVNISLNSANPEHKYDTLPSRPPDGGAENEDFRRFTRNRA